MGNQEQKRVVYSAYRFLVEIDGLTEATFSECSGLQAETEIFEWEEGGLNGFRHRLPGRTKYGNLVLKRGVATPELWKWYHDVSVGKVLRRSVGIVLYGYAGNTPIRWDVSDAVPVKWLGPTLKSGAAEAAVETLELAHHGIERT